MINLMGRVFMNGTNDPFHAVNDLVCQASRPRSSWSTSTPRPPARRSPWAGTSMATSPLSWARTPTFPPPTSACCLNGTAYQTDVGMSGPYDSVIGVEKDLVLHRFLTGMPGKFEAAKGNPKMCATLVTCDCRHGPRLGDPAHHARRVILPTPTPESDCRRKQRGQPLRLPSDSQDFEPGFEVRLQSHRLPLLLGLSGAQPPAYALVPPSSSPAG